MDDEKEIVRWDPKRNKWRRVFWRYPRDGSRRLSRDWWNSCLSCGAGYWSSPSKKICWDCSKARYKKLEELSTKAVGEVARAIREGNLSRLDGSIACVDCGKPAQVYDHRSYLRPLDVDPVCRSCNAKRGPAIEHEAIVVRLPKNFQPARRLASADLGPDAELQP